MRDTLGEIFLMGLEGRLCLIRLIIMDILLMGCLMGKGLTDGQIITNMKENGRTIPLMGKEHSLTQTGPFCMVFLSMALLMAKAIKNGDSVIW